MNKSTRYNAIIVLGGGRTNEGDLTPLSIQRLNKGIELYKEGVSNKVVALGGHYSTYSPHATRFQKTGAYLRGEYLIRGGVSASDVIFVEDGKDTIGEAFASRQKMRALGIRSISLVTSDKHLDRSLFIFRRIYGEQSQIEGIGVPSADLLNSEEEAEYLGVAKKFFSRLPHEIPDPNLDSWYSDHSQLYQEYKTIHDRFHLPGNESQAYMGVRK